MKKLIIGIIIGIILTISINYVGASIESSGVMYNSKTLNTVLDDLYSKIEEINNTGDAPSSDILIGKTALVKGTKVTGTMPSYADNGYYYVGTDVGYINNNIYLRFPAGAYLKTNTTGFVETWTEAKNIGLTADKILAGKTAASVTGTATSDATASASNILSGKTAYVNGSKLTGSMANKSGTTTAATTVTKSGNNALITIPTNGYYSTSSKMSVPIETIKNALSLNSSDYKIQVLFAWSETQNGGTINKSSSVNVAHDGIAVIYGGFTNQNGDNQLYWDMSINASINGKQVGQYVGNKNFNNAIYNTCTTSATYNMEFVLMNNVKSGNNVSISVYNTDSRQKSASVVGLLFYT